MTIGTEVLLEEAMRRSLAEGELTPVGPTCDEPLGLFEGEDILCEREPGHDGGCVFYVPEESRSASLIGW